MDKFKKYAEILKNFSKDMEMWKACEEDEIADAKEKYTSKALPEQLEKIKSVYEKRYQGDFECKIKNRVPVSLPCVPDRDGNSANRKVIVLSFIASLL